MKVNQCIAQAITRKLHPLNKQIKLLNYGGCGIVAMYLHATLYLLGFKPKIICLELFDSIEDGDGMSSKEENEQNNELIKRSKEDENLVYDIQTCNHYAVKIGSFIIDSTGIGKIFYHKYFGRGIELGGYEYKIVGEIEFDDLAHMNQYPRLWCSGYNRRNNDKVRSFIKRHVTEKLLYENT